MARARSIRHDVDWSMRNDIEFTEETYRFEKGKIFSQIIMENLKDFGKRVI